MRQRSGKTKRANEKSKGNDSKLCKLAASQEVEKFIALRQKHVEYAYKKRSENRQKVMKAKKKKE